MAPNLKMTTVRSLVIQELDQIFNGLLSCQRTKEITVELHCKRPTTFNIS